MALRALSAGADITAAYRTPRAQRLLRETAQRATRAVDVPVDEPVVCGELTVLHLAARIGQPAMLEFLLQVRAAAGGFWIFASAGHECCVQPV
jgi:hypothetical protein